MMRKEFLKFKYSCHEKRSFANNYASIVYVFIESSVFHYIYVLLALVIFKFFASYTS